MPPPQGFSTFARSPFYSSSGAVFVQNTSTAWAWCRESGPTNYFSSHLCGYGGFEPASGYGLTPKDEPSESYVEADGEPGAAEPLPQLLSKCSTFYHECSVQAFCLRNSVPSANGLITVLLFFDSCTSRTGKNILEFRPDSHGQILIELGDYAASKKMSPSLPGGEFDVDQTSLEAGKER